MNMLNSVLIEGNVIDLPIGRDLKNTAFEVVSIRITNNKPTNEKPTMSEVRMTVVVAGNLADVARVECYKGRGVRVVGRLIQDNAGRIELMAEHIEYKPVFDKLKAE